MPASAPTTYPYTYAAVMDALPRILPSLGFQVVSQDMATGMVKIRGGGGNLMSVGESLTIRVGTNHPSYSTVQVDSGVRLGVMTYARTTTNFNNIFNLLTQYLDQYYQAHRAPDAPPVPLPPPPAAAQQPAPQAYPPPHQQPPPTP